jgi:hypothetical protein
MTTAGLLLFLGMVSIAFLGEGETVVGTGSDLQLSKNKNAPKMIRIICFFIVLKFYNCKIA